LLIAAVTLILPFVPLAGPFGFQPLPTSYLLVMGLIVVFYIVAAETAKRIFYQRVKF